MRFLLLLSLATTLSAQGDQEIEQLYASGEYARVADSTAVLHNPSPDAFFWRGMSLGRLERWEEARQAFAEGRAAAPDDPRFPTELAGVSYRLEQRRSARRWLRRALQLAPDDEYARNFLGTLYLLDDNLEAALAHWNQLDQPRLASVETPPSLHTKPVLLDRALTFSPAETLLLDEVYSSRTRLDLLDSFAVYDFDLAVEPTGNYKLRLRGFERRGWSGSPWINLAQAARGLPYQTALLEYDNGSGDASSLHALARWDDHRRRASISYSRPLLGEARYRWRLFADARDERWRLARGASLSDFQLQKAEIGAGFDSAVNGSLRWGGEFAAVLRSFAGDATDAARTPDAAGARTDVFFHWTALRLPARRVTVSTETRLGLGSVAGEPYGRTESAAELRWSSGSQWSFRSRLSAGALPGAAPFDELYILGVERDNRLDFRGIRGAANGRKGSAPVGDRFWLSSTDLTRRIARVSLLDIHAGPFFDVGSVADRRGQFGSGGAQLAAGLQLELRLFGVFGLKLLYGRDLRTGQDLFFSRPYPDSSLRR